MVQVITGWVFDAKPLLTELKKINKVNRKTVNSVDGYVSDKDIAEVFANKYRQIFTSAKSDGLELEKKAPQWAD